MIFRDVWVIWDRSRLKPQGDVIWILDHVSELLPELQTRYVLSGPTSVRQLLPDRTVSCCPSPMAQGCAGTGGHRRGRPWAARSRVSLWSTRETVIVSRVRNGDTAAVVFSPLPRDVLSRGWAIMDASPLHVKHLYRKLVLNPKLPLLILSKTLNPDKNAPSSRIWDPYFISSFSSSNVWTVHGHFRLYILKPHPGLAVCCLPFRSEEGCAPGSTENEISLPRALVLLEQQQISVEC